MRFYLFTLLLPTICLIILIINKFAPPQDMQSTNGYCTKKSKQSKEVWEYTQVLYKKSLPWVVGVEFIVSIISIIYYNLYDNLNIVFYLFLLIEFIIFSLWIGFMEYNIDQKAKLN